MTTPSTQPAPYIGIDFGTSKSTMAWYNPKTGQAEVIRNAEGEEKTPSLVYFGDGKDILVGRAAEYRLEDDEGRWRVVKSVKRHLARQALIALPGGKRIRPVEVATAIFGKLRYDAEHYKFDNVPVRRVAVTVPAAFTGEERKSIKEAAADAGFEEVELVEEPVAAALTYAHVGLKASQRILVYDLGAGTFDLAVIARQGDGSWHLALPARGDRQRGGDDFDEALYAMCDDLARRQLGRPISLSGTLDLRFLRQCRIRKENLSFQTETTFSSLLESESGPVTFKHKLRREELEERIRESIEVTVRMTESILRDASANGHLVDTVVLIGGSSRVPLVQNLLDETLAVKPTRFDQMDVAVALGAAYYAKRIWRPDPVDEYRQAVEVAWHDRQITREEAQRLPAFAWSLDLLEEDAARVEREVIGESIEEIARRISSRDEYTAAVRRAWAQHKLTPLEVERLSELAGQLKIEATLAGRIERDVMGSAKEEILRFQNEANRKQYIEAVQAAGAGGRLMQADADRLSALATQLGLDTVQAASIEKGMLGDTKEEVVRRLAAESSYDAALRQTQPGKMSGSEVKKLLALAGQLGLTPEQVQRIERGAIGRSKEQAHTDRVQADLSSYRQALRRAWADGRISRRDLRELAAAANGLDPSKAQLTEAEHTVLGNTKEVIYERTRPMLRGTQAALDQIGTQFVQNCVTGAGNVMRHMGWTGKLQADFNQCAAGYAQAVQNAVGQEANRYFQGFVVPPFSPKAAGKVAAVRKKGKAGALGRWLGALSGIAGMAAVYSSGALWSQRGETLAAITVGAMIVSAIIVSWLFRRIRRIFPQEHDKAATLKVVEETASKLQPVLKVEAEAYITRVNDLLDKADT
ncbi:MAG TPA: Hsp70 family protein [Chloroflexia bacterium]|nr:Hsp70 family protein [Chloroflexia bacterium]